MRSSEKLKSILAENLVAKTFVTNTDDMKKYRVSGCAWRRLVTTLKKSNHGKERFSGTGEVKQFHPLTVKTGLWCDIYVQNTLVHVYSISGDIVSAGKVFDDMLVRDVVSWTGFISGYVKAGLFNEAIGLFLRMDVEPNVATFVSILGDCGKLGCLNLGRGIHELGLKCLYVKELVVCNAVLDMYEVQMFDEIPEKDIISWTSMISGLVQRQCPRESLDLFCQMLVSGFELDGVLLTCVLSACASLGLLDYGRWVHEYIDSHVIKWDVHIGTALVDMYAKCGYIDMAQRIFNGMPSRNIRTWNAYIGGLAINGHGREALKLIFFSKDVLQSTTSSSLLQTCFFSENVLKDFIYLYIGVTN
ncbi:unnamed protein product [Sphenostylis stenocarpa]|uniref:Pentatricopeptide repeat-containing protein n=1 Tax=Sphenostylis stenocarpa TaxID=92480 RepID=A0AA86W2E1_9FABA|nr:unnamed protein product [Sphenostylis stenocarpa]